MTREPRENYAVTQARLYSLLHDLVDGDTGDDDNPSASALGNEMTQQAALRDILTDLHHVAEFEELDWPFALQEALEVWNEEQENE